MKKPTSKDLWQGYTTIVVRDEDIILASRDTDKKGKCPIWFAIMRVIPPGFTVKVLRTSIEIYPGKGNKGMRGRLPWEAEEFGIYWDLYRYVCPMSFAVNFGI